ncbi:MAG TPA: COX15/CtaA family protein [Blastocatellia bacterium]|nr:COX15/CtaA family protein [Blastocatellia bacterium]
MKVQRGIEAEGGPHRGIHWFAIILAGMTLVLLIAGALVTTRDAGDSVPDWPLSFGRWLIHSDHFVANVRYEYSHRFIAGVVGVTTFAFAVAAYLSDRRRWFRRLAIILFLGVVAQALIGGIRVLFPTYKPLIAVPHALVAQSFFSTIVAMAVFTSKSWWERKEAGADHGSPPLRRLSAVTVGAVLVQLVLGAGFRHQAFGIVPHIIGAVAVTALVVWTAAVVFGRHGEDVFLKRPASLALALLLAQIVLGVASYLARLASHGDPQPLEPLITLTALHLIVGACTLATLVVLTLRSHRVLAVRPEQAERKAGGPSETLRSPRGATV